MKTKSRVLHWITATYLISLLGISTQAKAETSVNFVGELDSYIGHIKPAGDSDTKSTTGIESNGLTTSYLGVHGSQDLDNGLTAIASIEAFLRPDSGELGRFPDDIMFARAANFGLKGDFGQFTIGRNASLYFLSAIIFNPFGDSFSFSPMVLSSFGGGGLYGDTGWSNSVVYTTPTTGGFTTSFAYAFGEEAGETGTNKIAANTFYSSGDFGLTAAVQKISGTQPGATGLGPDEEQTDAIVGVSYKLGASTLYAQYQTMRDKLTGENSDIDRDTLVLSASIAVGKGAIYLGLGHTTIDTEGSDYDRNIYTLMYNLPLSKKLDLYFGYTSDDPEWTEETGQVLGAGGRYRF